MCSIFSIFQSEKDPTIQNSLELIIGNQTYRDKDGVGILAVNKENKKFFHNRSLIFKPERLEKAIQKYDQITVHLRTSTSGNIGIENVHLWRNKDWFFAHNGVAFTVPKVKGKFQPSDSYLLFREFCQNKYLKQNGELKWAKIIARLRKYTYLWGRIVFYNHTLRKFYFLGDWHLYSLGKKTLVVSSLEIDFTDFHHLFGIGFSNPAPYPITEKELDGVFSITLQRGNFKMLKNEKTTWKSWDEKETKAVVTYY